MVITINTPDFRENFLGFLPPGGIGGGAGMLGLRAGARCRSGTGEGALVTSRGGAGTLWGVGVGT